ncbi:MAG: Dinitrogenase iron-molybdenum cofactor [Bacteroidetes bacterium ADurb.Bin408]|nr:MAG: Dinitrogenase iron-molybdenum cofactor [Bacteroidetes bacterium ADurb.Bin408]
MKIAITSTGNTLNEVLDERFGRCAFFVIYDTEKKTTEFLQNPHAEADSGAGPAAVQFIAERGVSKIISGEFGFKIKSLLDSLKIQMIVIKEPNRKINEIIKMLNL